MRNDLFNYFIIAYNFMDELLNGTYVFVCSFQEPPPLNEPYTEFFETREKTKIQQ